MTMDVSTTTIPDSTQINADDLIGSPITVTVESVTAGNAEQPINIALVETPGRAYRPSKSMRRVLVACWGSDSAAYIGRRLTLYREPSIRFGRDVVGGVRISHASHLDGPVTVPLTVARGKRESFTVQPLPDAPTPASKPAEPSAEDVATCTDLDVLREWWKVSNPTKRKLIEDRKAALEAEESLVQRAEFEGEAW